MAGNNFRSAVRRLVDAWQSEGLPGRNALVQQVSVLARCRGSGGLWDEAPILLTATIDDGIGQGIDLIGRCASAVGMQVEHLGLMQPAGRIVDEARRLGADWVGLTVLQLDSEPILAGIAQGLPSHTGLVVGGPAFRVDPDLAARTGATFVAEDAAAFLAFLLEYRPERKRPV